MTRLLPYPLAALGFLLLWLLLQESVSTARSCSGPVSRSPVAASWRC